MKDIIRDDRKYYLPNVIMFLLSLGILELVIVLAICFKNLSLVSTAIGLFEVVMALMAVIYATMTGKMWMTSLRNQAIWQVKKREGKSLDFVICSRAILYSAILFLSEMLFGLFLVVDKNLIYNRFKSLLDEDKQEQFKKILGEQTKLKPEHILAILEYLLIAVMLIMMVIWIVSFTYNSVSQGRFAGILAGAMYVSILYGIIRIYLGFAQKVNKNAEKSLVGIAYFAFVVLIFYLWTRFTTKKHQWDVEEV